MPLQVLAQPDSRPIKGGYELYEAYDYRWEHHGVRYSLVVPRGFRYDGASVPRIVWTLTGILPDGLIRAGALIHDWLYANGGSLPFLSFSMHVPKPGGWEDMPSAKWSRKAADRMFGRLLREAGVSRRRRRAAYLAVRAFGWWPWYSRAVRRYFSSQSDYS